MTGLVFGLVLVAGYLLVGVFLSTVFMAVWLWLDDRRDHDTRPVAPLIPLDLGRERRRQVRGRAR